MMDTCLCGALRAGMARSEVVLSNVGRCGMSEVFYGTPHQMNSAVDFFYSGHFPYRKTNSSHRIRQWHLHSGQHR